jgi:hypothetical protein
MIRDPSDGSVREIVHDAPRNPADSGRSPELSVQVSTLDSGNKADQPECVSRPDASTAHMSSGLRAGSTKPENIARLEKSREWLRDYLKDRDA